MRSVASSVVIGSDAVAVVAADAARGDAFTPAGHPVPRQTSLGSTATGPSVADSQRNIPQDPTAAGNIQSLQHSHSLPLGSGEEHSHLGSSVVVPLYADDTLSVPLAASATWLPREGVLSCTPNSRSTFPRTTTAPLPSVFATATSGIAGAASEGSWRGLHPGPLAFGASSDEEREQEAGGSFDLSNDITVE